MHGATVKPFAAEHHDLAGDARFAHSEQRKWSLGASLFLMIGINTLLWTAIYLAAQHLL